MRDTSLQLWNLPFFILIFLWPQRGNNRHIFIIQPRTACRFRFRRGVLPVVNLHIARKASIPQLALKLRKFNLLIVKGIIRDDVRLLQVDLIVLPAKVTESQRPGSRELLKRPCALAFEFRYAFAKITAARDGSGFAEIEVSVVAGLDLRMPKVADPPTRFQVRTSGVPLEGMHIGKSLSQAEFCRRHPGERPEVAELRVHLAEQKPPFVARSQEGVLHLQFSTMGGKIQRDFLAVPKQLTMPHLEAIDGKIEKLFDRSLPRTPQNARSRNVRRAVGINRNVNQGMIKNDVTKSEFRAQKGDDLHAGDQPVRVGQRNRSRGLAPAHR